MSKAELLVEGKNDQHVVWALCELYDIPENFSIVIPGEGVEDLLKSIPTRLKTSKSEMLGILLDADQDIKGRWASVCSKLEQAGYLDLPKKPDENGTIIEREKMPRVGIWIMPNNKLSGMLEDFVSCLLPDNNKLGVKAESVLADIESESLNKYPDIHHQKAFIHTWLAWQETPGQPMGLAITAHALKHDQEIAQKFVGWLNKLFNS